MKIQLSAALIAALALGGCAPQTDAARQQAAATPASNAPVAGATAAAGAPAANGAAAVPGDQTQTAQVAPKKKKCADATTGSRLGSCNGMNADSVQGSTGDDYRDSALMPNTFAPKNPK